MENNIVEILTFLDNWQHDLCLIFFKNVPLYGGKVNLSMVEKLNLSMVETVYGGNFDFFGTNNWQHDLCLMF